MYLSNTKKTIQAEYMFDETYTRPKSKISRNKSMRSISKKIAIEAYFDKDSGRYLIKNNSCQSIEAEDKHKTNNLNIEITMQHAIRKRSYDSPTVAPAVVSVRNFKKIEVSKIVKLASKRLTRNRSAAGFNRRHYKTNYESLKANENEEKQDQSSSSIEDKDRNICPMSSVPGIYRNARYTHKDSANSIRSFKDRVSILNTKIHEDGRKYIKESIEKMDGVLNKIIEFKQSRSKPKAE